MGWGSRSWIPIYPWELFFSSVGGNFCKPGDMKVQVFCGHQLLEVRYWACIWLAELKGSKHSV